MSKTPPIGHLNLGYFDEPSGMNDSMPPFGIGKIDAEHGVVLKDWSAQDFANLYVRFRPHLISHARKFLGDESQAEEVVQDAFLYLMTALPELDSELGVLRFLKWKTKMLCLDEIRSSQSGINKNLIPLPDDVAYEAQPRDSLERADDAAVIRMALAKLSPRHREALIATMYEEKSHEQVAEQMGVSENAFRQLLFRARASFKVALVGEAEIKGKTVAEILTVAARKAATARTAVLVALFALGGLSIFPLVGHENQPLAAQINPNIESQSAPQESVKETETGAASLDPATPAASEMAPAFQEPSKQNPSKNEASISGSEMSQARVPSITEQIDETNQTKVNLARDSFNSLLDETLVLSLASKSLELSRDAAGNIAATNNAGLRAYFSVDLDAEKVVQFLLVEFETEGQVWKAVPNNSLSVVEKRDGKTIVSYAATDFLVGDFSGSFDYVSTTDSVFSRSGIKLDFVLDASGGLVESKVEFLPNS